MKVPIDCLYWLYVHRCMEIQDVRTRTSSTGRTKTLPKMRTAKKKVPRSKMSMSGAAMESFLPLLLVVVRLFKLPFPQQDCDNSQYHDDDDD